MESELSAKTVRRIGSVPDRQAQGSEFVHNAATGRQVSADVDVFL
jgi:hypothetical protein